MEREHANTRNEGCRIREYSYRGYDALILENDKLRISLLPGKGSDIIEFYYKPQDVDFMWRSSPGLQHRNAIVLNANSRNSFLDYYPGGWQEIVPNFGDSCEYKGASLGLHDEVSLLAWESKLIEDHPEQISVSLSVRCVRTPFRLSKKLTLGTDCRLRIEEELTNESREQVDCTWGHHPAIGAPFLDENCRVIVPPCRVKTQEAYVSPNSRLEQAQDCEWPRVSGRKEGSIDLSRIPPPSAHSHDMAYLYGFCDGWYALFHEGRSLGFSMAWDASIFRYLWFWQVYGGWSGYPWYGTSYNIGLEPCTSYPPSLAGAIAAGTQLTLEPGQSIRTDLAVSVITDLNEFLQGKGLSGRGLSN